MAKKSAAEVKKHRNNQIVATNRKARHNYSILEMFEAGVALMGTEVKSLREGQASLADAFATVDDGESLAAQRAHPRVSPRVVDQPRPATQPEAAAAPRPDRRV